MINLKKISIPIIRNVYPNLMASEICSVQPMTASSAQIFSMKTSLRKFNILQDHGDVVTISCNDEVHQWIQDQEISQWKFEYDVKNYTNTFLLTKELYTMLLLKWG